MSTVIRFHRVSKRFMLHHQRPRSFQELAIRLFQRNGEACEQELETAAAGDGRRREEFWALRDVSFTVEQGETVGIIGPNGAGKSTALKLISRIIEPTSGEIEVSGRVGALLELGAGFHPDLSGRENIYLNGSILGLSRVEIDRKLDDIVAFTELERFIDMPVKHYSSGMRLRLGFSVAAHIDPEVLLIDEVLAVGDIGFQHKCWERISTLQQKGVTIVFVSHSVQQVADLCERAFWLEDGTVHSGGSAAQVVEDYLSSSDSERPSGGARWEESPPSRVTDSGDTQKQQGDGGASDGGVQQKRWGNENVLIQDVRLIRADQDDAGVSSLCSDQSVRVEIDYIVKSPLEQSPVFGIAIYRADGVWCYGTNTELDTVRFSPPRIPVAGTVAAELRKLQLLQDTYTVDVGVHAAGGKPVYDYIKDSLSFSVLDERGDRGVFRPELCWSLRARE